VYSLKIKIFKILFFNIYIVLYIFKKRSTQKKSVRSHADFQQIPSFPAGSFSWFGIVIRRSSVNPVHENYHIARMVCVCGPPQTYFLPNAIKSGCFRVILFALVFHLCNPPIARRRPNQRPFLVQLVFFPFLIGFLFICIGSLVCRSICSKIQKYDS